MTVPLSIIKAIFKVVTFKLRFPRHYCNKTIKMDDGSEFRTFRHMHLTAHDSDSTGSIFIVHFKFKRFSHKTNVRLSRIPILMIAGFPGFRDKLWMIDHDTDYWQGIYQFASGEAIDGYRQSFVLHIMNKRAQSDSITYQIIRNQEIDNYLEARFVT